MILGIGIDSIEINRFRDWHVKPYSSLARIFTHSEIEYCLMTPRESAERFAVRFAAREGLFKAINKLFKQRVPFLTLCKHISIQHDTHRAPYVQVDWKKLEYYLPTIDPHSLTIHMSITHTRTIATAFIIMEQQ